MKVNFKKNEMTELFPIVATRYKFGISNGNPFTHCIAEKEINSVIESLKETKELYYLKKGSSIRIGSKQYRIEEINTVFQEREFDSGLSIAGYHEFYLHNKLKIMEREVTFLLASF